MPKMYKCFTMAEVLITIGVIGLVAALTIPHLTSHYRKKVAETRLARFYSVINAAITMSEVDHGPKEYWEQLGKSDEEDNVENGRLNIDEWFEIYLKKYIKYSHLEINNTSKRVMIYFSDGSLCLISGASFHYWLDAGTFEDYQTDEGSEEGKNNMELSGVKYFTFYFNPYTDSERNHYHYKKGVEPYMYDWDGKRETLLNSSTIGCQKTVSNERAYCTALIQQNGWKIPKDYPLKF